MVPRDSEPLRPSDAVRASVSGDGLVLLDVSGGVVLSSNGIGARIWQLIEQHRSPREIAQQLALEYAESLDRVHPDVMRFVTDLAGRGLVDGERRR